MIIDNNRAWSARRAAARQRGTFRVGIAGAGWVTQYHLPAWREQAHRARVVAVADPDESRRNERLRQNAVPAGFTSAEQMIETGDIDILDICAPRELHAELARLGNAKGLAVLCQKPLATDLAAAEALVGDVDREGPLMVHDNWRFRATYRRVKQWLDAGVAGMLRRVELYYLSSGMIPDATGQRPALIRQPNFNSIERLLVMEVLIHQLDTLRFLLGEFELLDARLARSNDAIVGEDVATLTLRRREDWLPVELVGNLAAHGEPAQARDQLRIFGSSATITLDGYRLRCTGNTSYDEQFDPDDTYQGSYSAAIAHFLDGIERCVPFETNPRDNLRTLALVEAAYGKADDMTSARHDRPAEHRRQH